MDQRDEKERTGNEEFQTLPRRAKEDKMKKLFLVLAASFLLSGCLWISGVR